MIKIRLQRIGRRNQPFYRVVVTDSQNGPRSGRFIEILGSYNPKQGTVDIKKDRAEYWLNNGAQTSGTMHNFLVDQGVIKGKKLNVLPKKSSTKKRKAPDVEPEPPAPAVVAEPAVEPVVETPQEAAPVAEEPVAEVTIEEPVAEAPVEETPKEEVKEETPAE